MILKNKKAIGYTEIVFILLNLIVFSFLLLFISLTSNNALVYEQTYAKQIALAIDAGKPGMTLIFDISKGMEIANKNKKTLDETFKIDSTKREVFVSLDKKGGYSFKYFSDYDVTLQLDGNKLNLIIK